MVSVLIIKSLSFEWKWRQILSKNFRRMTWKALLTCKYMGYKVLFNLIKSRWLIWCNILRDVILKHISCLFFSSSSLWHDMTLDFKDFRYVTFVLSSQVFTFTLEQKVFSWWEDNFSIKFTHYVFLYALKHPLHVSTFVIDVHGIVLMSNSCSSFWNVHCNVHRDEKNVNIQL